MKQLLMIYKCLKMSYRFYRILYVAINKLVRLEITLGWEYSYLDAHYRHFEPARYLRRGTE